MDCKITDKRTKHRKTSVEKRKRKRSSSESNSERHKKGKNHRKEKKKKRLRSPSSSSTTSLESENEKKLRKLKRKQRKEAKKLKKELKKNKNTGDDEQSSETNDIPIALMEKAKGMAPMTKDEWEKKQNVIRKVYDEQTGRHRLIKGDGEVIEEIVSKERHHAINREATKGDANYFQAHLTANMSNR